jgi:hypothetical protein
MPGIAGAITKKVQFVPRASGPIAPIPDGGRVQRHLGINNGWVKLGTTVSGGGTISVGGGAKGLAYFWGSRRYY